MRNKEQITTSRSDDAVRITATVTAEQERQLKALAAHTKVSVAWLVREAIDRMLAQSRGLGPLESPEHEQ